MNRRVLQGKLNLQSWVGGEVVATVAEWLNSIGQEPKSMSHLVESALEALAEIAIDNGQRPIVDATEIEQVLQSIALNRVRGRSLSRMSRRRMLLSEQYRSHVEDGLNERPEMVTKEHYVAEKERQMVEQAALPHEIKAAVPLAPGGSLDERYARAVAERSEERKAIISGHRVDPEMRATILKQKERMHAVPLAPGATAAGTADEIGESLGSDASSGEFSAARLRQALEAMIVLKAQGSKSDNTPSA